MSIVGLGWLIVKLLVLALVYFGIKWLVEWLGVAVPDIIMKIFAAILVIIGFIWILMWLGVF
jgi:hypothetical protein